MIRFDIKIIQRGENNLIFVSIPRPDIDECMLDCFCMRKLICFGSQRMPHLRGGGGAMVKVRVISM